VTPYPFHLLKSALPQSLGIASLPSSKTLSRGDQEKAISPQKDLELLAAQGAAPAELTGTSLIA